MKRQANITGYRWRRPGAWLLVIHLFSAIPYVTAQQSQYLILRAPAISSPHPSHHASKPVQPIFVEAQPYAYGWFGAQPRRQWSRHFGYYRNYTEWSGK